jgi:hypothetical protein
MSTKSIRIHAGLEGVLALTMSALALHVGLWAYQRIDKPLGTLKSAWFDNLPLEVRVSLTWLIIGASGIFFIFLAAVVIFRVPIAVLDESGIRVWSFKRRFIAWQNIRSIDISTNIMKIEPREADTDQRAVFLAFQFLVSRDRLIEAVHVYRWDLVPLPRSLLRRRAAEPKLKQKTPAQPPITFDSKNWTG